MKNILLGCLFLAFASATAYSQDLNKKYFDKMVGGEILIDQCNRQGLEEGAFGEIFKTQYSDYNPDELTINEIKNQLDGITITIVFGSWCHDSKVQVPKFFKILDQLNFNEKQLTIVAVDRLKKSHDFDIKGLKIKYVPTFIVYRNKKEIGRIVESPKETLEKDLLKILN